MPASGGYNYLGEYYYDPAYLVNIKTHVLYKLRKIQLEDGRYAIINENKNLIISNYDEFGYSESPAIVKDNVTKLDLCGDCV